MTEKRRMLFLDMAKGISIILVMMGHSCGFPFGGVYFTTFAMPLFFFVSGYTYKSGRSYGENMKRRAKRLLIPYFGYSLLLFVLYAVKELLTGNTSIRDYVMAAAGVLYSRNCLYPLGYAGENVYFFKLFNEATWFLTGMFIASGLFFAIVDKCIKNSRIMWISIAACIIASAVLSYLPVLLPWSMDTACMSAAFMLCGAWSAGNAQSTADSELREKKGRENLIGFAALTVYIALCTFDGSTNFSIRNYGNHGLFSVVIYFLSGVTGSYACLWLCRLLERTGGMKWAAQVGNNTLMLLCLHLVLFAYMDKAAYVLIGNLLHNRAVYWLYGGAKIVIVILLCYGLDRAMTEIKRRIKGKDKV